MTEITCPICETVSHNSHDVRERYCGNCHVFLGSVAEAISARAQDRAADNLSIAGDIRVIMARALTRWRR